MCCETMVWDSKKKKNNNSYGSLFFVYDIFETNCCKCLMAEWTALSVNIYHCAIKHENRSTNNILQIPKKYLRLCVYRPTERTCVEYSKIYRHAEPHTATNVPSRPGSSACYYNSMQTSLFSVFFSQPSYHACTLIRYVVLWRRTSILS